MAYPVVFIDRDGTINEEAGYINHIDSFRMFDFVPHAIRLLNKHNILTIVITNQGGIARGYFSEELVYSIHKKMMGDLSKMGAKIDAVYYCPHYPGANHPLYGIDCDCRKPKTGLIKRALADFDIDKRRMFVIGDKLVDMELAHNVGAYKILVRTGYGKGEELKIDKLPFKVDAVTDDLLGAVLMILENIKQQIKC